MMAVPVDLSCLWQQVPLHLEITQAAPSLVLRTSAGTVGVEITIQSTEHRRFKTLLDHKGTCFTTNFQVVQLLEL